MKLVHLHPKSPTNFSNHSQLHSDKNIAWYLNRSSEKIRQCTRPVS